VPPCNLLLRLLLGEVTAARIPSDADERVRDLVRWSRSPSTAGQLAGSQLFPQSVPQECPIEREISHGPRQAPIVIPQLLELP
jgi:hypothetical protein